jgi:hypothetical protein
MLTRLSIKYLCALAFLVSSGFVSSNTQFTYNTVDDGIEVTGCVGECPSDLIIPEEIDGYPVTRIAGDAFWQKNLVSVSIPETVKKIGFWAFAENQLSTIVIPNSVTSIRESAFRSNQLTTVSLSNNITIIDDDLFKNNQLTSVIIPDGVTRIRGDAFQHNQLSTVSIPDSVSIIDYAAFQNNQLTSVNIPHSVKNISERAFANNLLSDIELHNEIETIGVKAFFGNNLSAIVFPKSVTEVKNAAFGDNSIQSINFLGNRPTLGLDVFNWNYSLENIYYCPGTAGWPGAAVRDFQTLITPQIDNACDSDGDGISNIDDIDDDNDGYDDELDAFPLDQSEWLDTDGDGIGNNTDNDDDNDGEPDNSDYAPLDDTVFSMFSVSQTSGSSLEITGCIDLCPSDIVIPEFINGSEVISIADSAFAYQFIESLSLPNTLETIGSIAFRGIQITSLVIPDSVTNIGYGAFKDVWTLTDLTIGSSVTRIEGQAFASTGLTSLNIPDNVTTLESYAFANTPLETLTIGSGLQTVYRNVFDKTCSTLRNISINSPSSLSKNGSYNDSVDWRESSFSAQNGLHFSDTECSNLETLTFGENITSIGNSVFTGLTNLTELNLGSAITSIGSSNFANSKLTSLVIPDSVTSIGSYAFKDVSTLTGLTIGSSVTIIGQQAFASSGLTSLNIPDNVTTLDSYAFANTPLETLNIGNGLSNVYRNVFDKTCGTLRNISINSPSSLIKDGGYNDSVDWRESSFSAQNGLHFSDTECSNLETLTFGENITSIGDSVFTGLQSDIYFLGNKPTIQSNAFANSSSEMSVSYCPNTTGWSDNLISGATPQIDASCDSDLDGIINTADSFPFDSDEYIDTDSDGIGNNVDTDDDNDGIADTDDSDPLNDAIGALESQSIFVMGNPIAVNGYITTISVGYDVLDANAQLTGIGYRVHYDSTIFSLSEIQNTLANSNVVDGFGPYQDVENFDNDNTTDSYITFAWASVGGDWPNIELPAQLTDINLFVNWANYEAGSTTSNINFSVIDNAQGYEAEVVNYPITVLPATWDFDGNGIADALTDGLMLLRYTFNLRDQDITTNAISTDSTLSPIQIADNIHRAVYVADIDGDGSTDALTDGLLLLRYLFNLRGDSLINGVISFDATRTSAEEIEQYIELYMPPESIETNQCITFANSDEVICTSTTGTTGITGTTSTCSPLPDVPCESTSGTGTTTTSISGIGLEEQNFMVGDWRLAGVPDQREYEEGALQDWNFYGSAYSQVEFDSCVADDIYRFGETGTFEYLINGSTYINEELNPLYDWNDYTSSSCVSPLAPWNEGQIYTYGIDESNSLLTVYGYGAYIALAHVANGTDDLENAADAPESITYDFTKLSDTEVQLEIDAYDDFYRFTLERIVN